MKAKHAVAICLSLAVVLPSVEASAEIYRWTDAAGRSHFTADLNQVPPAHRKAAREGASVTRSGGQVNLIPGASPDARKAPATRPTPGPARARGDAARSGGGSAGSTSERIGGRDEAGWRREARQYASKIERLERAVDACEDVEAPRRYNEKSGRRMKRQHYDRKMGAVDRCAQTRFNLGATQRQWDNMAERARKNGVPPGWLRAY